MKSNKIFTEHYLNSLTEKFVTNPAIVTVTKEEQILCDKEITLEECSQALKSMSNNKSPGCDGLPTEFYKFFWAKIKKFVINSFKWSLENGHLSLDQKRGIITLVPKKDKDLCQLTNWRPISVLNTDYNLLTKIYASRLQIVLQNIINPDQVGYIKSRFIGENIRTIQDIIEYSSLFKHPGLVVLLDFEKAFDSVSLTFLFKCLKAFGFGEKFISFVQTLYTDIESCVTNNGFASPFFKLYRGIRQGCCLSALLFLLIVEILAIIIRSDRNVCGINIDSTEFKISQLADDTTLFLKNETSLKNAFQILENFGLCSGLNLNKGKTELISLAKEVITDCELRKRITKGPFKTLGVWFSDSPNNMPEINLTPKLRELQRTINIWSGQPLSLKGKITVIKSLIISKIINICSMIFVPQSFIKEVNRMLNTFLWGHDKKPKVKFDTITNDIMYGGLKMVNFKHTITSIKAVWVKRMLCDCDSEHYSNKWRVLAKKMAGINDANIFFHKLNPDKLSLVTPLNDCYKQVLNCWYQFFSLPPNSYSDILQEKVDKNRFLCSDKNPLHNHFKFLTNNGIYTIGDLVSENHMLSQTVINKKYNCRI